jgi:glutaredoxin
MKHYIVYGITDCPSCLKAQALLMERDLEYVVVIGDFSKSYRHHIRQQLNWPTFPIIVEATEHNNTVIGGYDQLRAHIDGIASL